MLKYIISIILCFVFAFGYCQEQKNEAPEIENDSIVYKTNYGLRVGLDISKPIISFTNSTYSGLEIIADYRINTKIYIATEIGFEKETSIEDYTNSTAKGNYIRLGFNYNAYENWLDMNNEVFTGFRYGLGIFDQTLNSYQPNVVTGEVGNYPYFPSNTIISSKNSGNLMAHWAEFVIGIKVETLKNLFVGISGSYKVVLNVQNPDNFKTLYAPGFNRIFESGTGFGFNYSVSYLIPFSKK